MAPLWLVGVALLCAGWTPSTDGADDGAPVGVLYDSDRGRLLAETLLRHAADVAVTPAADCAAQVVKLREAGVHRFVSLCEETPTTGEDVLVTPGACPAWQRGCRSLQLPASSQWRVLAALVSQLELPRVLLIDDGQSDDDVFQAMRAQGVHVVPVSPVPHFPALTTDRQWHNLSDPAGSVAIVQERAALLSALQTLNSAKLRAEHWFVPGLAGAAAPLTNEERALLGDARVYTAHTGVEPTARLPEVPAGSSLSELAVALDALSVARGASGQGLTGPLAMSDDGARLDSFTEVLVYRPVDGSAALPPRAADWLPVAAMRGGTLLSPYVQYVLPSMLMPQLNDHIACGEGRLSVAGTDAVVGRAFRSEFSAREAPRLLLVYGSSPFFVSLKCANVTSDLQCGAADPSTCTLLERTHHGDAVAELPLSRHARDTSARQHGRRRAAWREASQQYRRSGRSGHTAPQEYHSGHYLADVNRAGGYDAEPTGVAPPQDQVAAYSQQDPNSVHERRDAGAPYQGYVSAPSLVPRPGFPQPPAQTGLAVQGPPNRRQYSTDVTKHEVLRLSLADLFGCFGSLGGCALCLQYFATYSTTQPENCYAACALGIGGTCAAAIGKVLSEAVV